MFLKKLGKRGAEMVEYAIVLACIASVGVGFYSSNDSKLTKVLDGLFGKVTAVVDLALGNDTKSAIKRAPLKGELADELQAGVNAAIDGIYEAYLEKNIPLRTLKIDRNGKMKEATYWTGNDTYEVLDSNEYITNDCNSFLEGTGCAFAVDGKNGNNATQLFFNQNGGLVMPKGPNERTELTDKMAPRLVIQKDGHQYCIEAWNTGDGVVKKDNEDTYLIIQQRY